MDPTALQGYFNGVTDAKLAVQSRSSGRHGAMQG